MNIEAHAQQKSSFFQVTSNKTAMFTYYRTTGKKHYSGVFELLVSPRQFSVLPLVTVSYCTCSVIQVRVVVDNARVNFFQPQCFWSLFNFSDNFNGQRVIARQSQNSHANTPRIGISHFNFNAVCLLIQVCKYFVPSRQSLC